MYQIIEPEDTTCKRRRANGSIFYTLRVLYFAIIRILIALLNVLRALLVHPRSVQARCAELAIIAHAIDNVACMEIDPYIAHVA